MRGLQWQTRFIPLSAGRGGSGDGFDARAMEAPLLSRAIDVEFDAEGGLQTRKPFATALTNIDGGGTLSNCRRVYANGDELLVFTKDTLYSLNSSTTKWANRGTHLAVKVQEQPVFVTTGDQIQEDRAELSGVIVYAWTDAGQVYAAARDKTTGAVITAPTAISTATDRPRLVALTTKILLFWLNGSLDLKVQAIDPTAPATGFASAATTVLAATNSYYDVVKIPSADTAIGVIRRSPTTSYEVFKCTAALSVTNSTKARTCDNSIAVAVSPDAAKVQVIRTSTTSVLGDRLTLSSLVDEATGQAVGTTVSAFGAIQIAAAYRSVQNGGQYRCYVFFSDGETTGNGDFSTKSNFVDTGGALGSQGIFVRRVGIASRAFDYDGSVYVHLVFAGQSLFTGAGSPLFTASPQNSYLLYRDDAFLAAKLVARQAAGFSASTCHLPGVALTSGTTGYSWCAGERRSINVGERQFDYADRGPRDVTITFDSNEARRVVRVGNTLYVASGEVLQYDGVGLYEVGYHVFPWTFGVIENSSAGSVDSGTHAFKQTWRWDNAAGDRERSTTATTGSITITAGSPRRIEWPDLKPLYTTHKTNRPVVVECWATAKDPTADAPFYLCTSKDPASTTNPNRYIANDTTVATLPQLNHEFSDATLTTKESNDENDGVIPALAPQAASIIAANDQRAFIAGVPGEPHRVFYSRLRNAGEVASFHGSLAIDVPPEGGDITALVVLDDGLVVFRETAAYAFGGEGFSNVVGVGQNYGPPRTLSTDVGAVSAEAVGRTPDGLLFKSNKGWQFMDRAFGVHYVGQRVADYDGETPLAVHVVESQHQVRILTSARMLVFDYKAGQWAEWSVADGLHATMWRGSHVYLTATGPRVQATDFTGINYGMDVETAWIPTTDDKMGNGVLRLLELLGEMRSNCFIRVRCAGNYQEGISEVFRFGYFHDKVIDPNTGFLGGSVGDPLGLKVTPRKQPPLSAVKIRLTVMGDTSLRGTLATNVGGNWGVGGTIGTSGTAWAATLRARNPGADGADLNIDIYTADGALGDVEVRDGETYDGTQWVDADDRVTGVRVGVGATVGALERAINDGSRWLEVSVADPSPSKVITDTNTTHTSVGMAGGTDAAPTGESVRLTGLDLELGFKPGLMKRVPARQQS